MCFPIFRTRESPSTEIYEGKEKHLHIQRLGIPDTFSTSLFSPFSFQPNAASLSMKINSFLLS